MLLDRFIEPTLKLDSDQLYRARVLVAAILAFTLILFTVALYLLTLAPIADSSALLSTLLVTFLNGILICVLGVLKTRGHYELCAHVACGATMLAITTGIVVSGGPLLSPATPICVVTIVMAFVLSGKRMGLIWTSITLTTHAVMLILLHVLGPFPQLLYMGYAEVHHVMHWTVTYVAIVGLMLIFDSINARLKRERDAERSRFEYLASHDPLTQLANRHVFDDRLRFALARARRHQHSVALFFIDLNGFKPINDKYGHDMGDRVLQVLAARLQTHFRNSDTVARLGGDEFAIIIEDLRDEQLATQLGRKIVNVLSDPIESLPPEITLGASIGIALCPQHAQDEEKLVRYADTAMYHAKRGRDSFRIFDPIMLESQVR